MNLASEWGQTNEKTLAGMFQGIRSIVTPQWRRSAELHPPSLESYGILPFFIGLLLGLVYVTG
jgi:hypothetical protein